MKKNYSLDRGSFQNNENLRCRPMKSLDEWTKSRDLIDFLIIDHLTLYQILCLAAISYSRTRNSSLM